MNIAFTGPEALTPVEEAFCRKELRQLRRRDSGLETWRSGAAKGLDTLVVEESGALQDVELYIPVGKRWNTALVEEYDFLAVYEIPGGFRRRNEALIEEADVLHAFPRYRRFYRSGTWMTINIARRAGIEVVLHVLSED